MLASYRDNHQGHIFDELGVQTEEDVEKKVSKALREQLAMWLVFKDGCGSENGLKAIENIFRKAKQYDEALAVVTSSSMPSSPTSTSPISTAVSIRKITPIESIVHADEESETSRAEWEKQGKQAIQQGSVAALVLAGGQGTRLGFDKPKGMFDPGLPSHKSLFHIQAERLKRIGELYNAPVPMWYVMTSPATHRETLAYFIENKYFGLEETRVYFFEQIELPCLTPQGKLILESDDRLATAPDGNGDMYGALERTGALAHMKANGINHVLQYSVDNLLIRMADPFFVGYCISQQADVGCKTVEKTSPEERVGVVCLRNGKPSVVEYSEISKADAAAKAPQSSSRLLYSAAHTCINYFSVDFITRAAAPECQRTMWHHVAKKAIPSRGENKKTEAWKLEQYIFDMFPNAAKLVVFQVKREEEFAPIKNAEAPTAADTPATARQLLSNLHRSYIEKAGGKIDDAGAEDGSKICEISPLLTFAGEGLDALVRGKTFQVPLHLS